MHIRSDSVVLVLVIVTFHFPNITSWQIETGSSKAALISGSIGSMDLSDGKVYDFVSLFSTQIIGINLYFVIFLNGNKM